MAREVISDMDWSGIALFYFGCFSFGFLFALIAVVLGEVLGHADIGGGHDVEIGHDVDMGGDVGEVGHDFDAGHDVGAGGDSDMGGASVLNSLTICTFLGFFGLAGLLAVWVLGMGPVASLAFALPVGILMAAAEFLIYVKVFIQAQASSEATLFETLGCQAEVITGIPAGRVGEIAYVIKGSRYSAPATGADGEEIPRGTCVQVVNVRGSTYVVRPM